LLLNFNRILVLADDRFIQYIAAIKTLPWLAWTMDHTITLHIFNCFLKLSNFTIKLLPLFLELVHSGLKNICLNFL